MLTGSIGYTGELTEYVIEQSKNSAAVKAQMEDPTIDILTGLPFHENTGSMTDGEKESEFRGYIASLDTAGTLEQAAQMNVHIVPVKIQSYLAWPLIVFGSGAAFCVFDIFHPPKIKRHWRNDFQCRKK